MGVKYFESFLAEEQALTEAKDPAHFLKKKLWINPKDIDKIADTIHLDKHTDKLETLQDSVHALLKELDRRDKLKLPLTYSGDPSYSYTIIKTTPSLVVESSDGEHVRRIKYFSDIGHYAESFWEDVFDQEPRSGQEGFNNKKKNQEDHELDQLRGDGRKP